MSSIQHVLRTHPAALPLGLSLLTTTSLFFGNLGLSAAGPVPIVDGTLGGAAKLSGKQKVAIWTMFFKRGMTFAIGGSALGLSSALAGAYLTSSPLARRLALAAAATTAGVMAYTLAMLAPTNARLLALDARPELAPAEEKEAAGLIDKWNVRHLGRVSLFGLANLAALAALYVERPF